MSEVPRPPISGPNRATHTDIVGELERMRGVETTWLTGTSEPLSLNAALPLAQSEDEAGNRQELLAVVTAGEERYGIIRATDVARGRSWRFVHRLSGEDDRPRAVEGYKPVTVGRQEDSSLSDDVSRRHFAVTYTDEPFVDNDLTVADLGSRNRTRVFWRKSESASDEPAPTTVKFVGLALRRFRDRQSSGGATSLADGLWTIDPKALQERYAQHAADTERVRQGLIRTYLGDSSGVHFNERSVARYVGIASRVIAAGDSTAGQIVYDALIDHSYRGIRLTDPYGKSMNQENRRLDSLRKALRFTFIYHQDPELAADIATMSIAGTHGSKSGSLLSVMEHGLVPGAEARTRPDIVLATGERAVFDDGQTDMSFTDWSDIDSLEQYAMLNSGPVTIQDLERRREQLLTGVNNRGPFKADIALAADLQTQIDYIKAHPTSLEAQLMLENFPVAYGVDVRGYQEYRTYADMDEAGAGPTGHADGGKLVRVISDMPGEFRVIDSVVPLERLPLFLVPRDQVKRVRQIAIQKGKACRVRGIEPLVTKMNW